MKPIPKANVYKIILALLNGAGLFLTVALGAVSDAPAFKDGINYLGVGVLACLAAVDIFLVFTARNRPRFLPKKISVAIFMFSVSALIVCACFGLDTVFNKGYSPLEGLMSNATVLFICLAAAFFITALLSVWDKKLAIAVTALFVFAFGVLSVQPISFIAKANAPFTNLGGLLSAEEVADTSGGMRKTRFSFADMLFGIKNDNFIFEEDTEYADGLRYDAYFPNSDGRHPVVVRFHGHNRDKGVKNMPGLSKYLAARGYAVYDVQYGDWQEDAGREQTADSAEWRGNEYYLQNIKNFFAYVTNSEKERARADFARSAMLGLSFGGQFAILSGLTGHTGVDVKAIVAYYPAYMHENGFADPENPYCAYTELVTADSPPLLIMIGKNDGYVKRTSVSDMQTAYAAAGNPYFAGVELDFFGHGFDSHFAGMGGQYSTYYTERVLAKFLA